MQLEYKMNTKYLRCAFAVLVPCDVDLHTLRSHDATLAVRAWGGDALTTFTGQVTGQAILAHEQLVAVAVVVAIAVAAGSSSLTFLDLHLPLLHLLDAFSVPHTTTL